MEQYNPQEIEKKWSRRGGISAAPQQNRYYE